MPSQLGINTNERDELLRKKALAERKLTSNSNLTAQQRESLLRYIRVIDSKLVGSPRYSDKIDVPSKGLNILSFLFPLVGLILFCVNLDSKPIKARAIGKWALCGFILSLVLSVAIFAAVTYESPQERKSRLAREQMEIYLEEKRKLDEMKSWLK